VPAHELSIAAVSGDNQLATVGTGLNNPLTARVSDGDGSVAAGIAVVFTVTWGNGLLDGQQTRTVLTDVNGNASVTWVIGPAAQTNTVNASLADDARRAVEFRATARPDVATRLVYGGGTRAAQVGAAVATAPAVAAVDRFGNRVGGVPVTFVAPDDGSRISGAVDTTDVVGMARLDEWVLGTRAGNYAVTATSPGLESFVFTATAHAGPAYSMEIVDGDGQEATVNTIVPVPPTIRVLDRHGNPVSGAYITFATGGEFTVPVLPSRAPFTSADGTLRVDEWRLGRRPGIYSMTVKSGALSVRFEATAVAGPPVRLLVHDGNFQAAPPRTTLLASPAVWVADAYGNRVTRAGIPVTFTVRDGGGAVTGAVATTDAQGVARVGSWTLGPATVVYGTTTFQTTNRLVAESPGLASVELVAFAR
jgi:hypothetical protein